MIEVLHNLVFGVGLVAWAFLIAISIHPTWGAEFGMWLRGDTIDPPAEPPAEAEGEKSPDSLVGRNLNRKV